jgi:hypothetical protein
MIKIFERWANEHFLFQKCKISISNLVENQGKLFVLHFIHYAPSLHSKEIFIRIEIGYNQTWQIPMFQHVSLKH